MKSLSIGLIGVGTVGRGVVNVLERNKNEISRRTGCNINLVSASARDVNKAQAFLGESVKVYSNPLDVVKDPKVEIVIELIGGTTDAKSILVESMRVGKPVITANKALLAEHGNELIDLASQHNGILGYEAAVAGGIPIVKALREGLTANSIQWVAGIVNGTTNFILTQMRDRQAGFAEALEEAQRLGFAEADPTFDIEGIDAAQKLSIIAALAFGISVEPNRVFTEGITKLEPIDVNAAEDFGYRIKLLGIARRASSGIELRVHPTLVPEKSSIAAVRGAMNAVLVQGDAVGPTLYYGAGAGAEPTASAVIADLVDISRLINSSPDQRVPYFAFEKGQMSDEPVLDIGDVVTSYYLRIRASDRPGVLADISRILADNNVSIEAMRQREPMGKDELVNIIILTHVTQERNIRAALERIEKLESVTGKVVMLRMEHLDFVND
ncbi:MAG: homoserine dehydrogenase [Betaproteobacteria bacterium]